MCHRTTSSQIVLKEQVETNKTQQQKEKYKKQKQKTRIYKDVYI